MFLTIWMSIFFRIVVIFNTWYNLMRMKMIYKLNSSLFFRTTMITPGDIRSFTRSPADENTTHKEVRSCDEDERSVAGSWRYYRGSTHRTDYVIRAPFSHTILSSAASYIVRSHCQPSSVCLSSKVSGVCSFRVKLATGFYCCPEISLRIWQLRYLQVVL